MSNLICIVSPHEKGFWQVDVYLDGWIEGLVPDWFCTGKVGGTKEEIVTMVKKEYPEAEFTDGATGSCDGCGEYHFSLDQYCDHCGDGINFN